MRTILFIFFLLSCKFAQAVTIEFGGYVVDSQTPILDTFIEGSITYTLVGTVPLGNETTYFTVTSQSYRINGVPLISAGSQGLYIRNDFYLGGNPDPIFIDGLTHRAGVSGTYNGEQVLGVIFDASSVTFGYTPSLYSDLSLPATLNDFVGTQASIALTLRDATGSQYSIDSNTGGYGNPAFFSYLTVNGENALIINGLVTTNTIPIPPALWLFGTGLLGLIGVARNMRHG